MGIETGPLFSDLNPAWPAGTEDLREGDDHLRHLKAVLKGTFSDTATSFTISKAGIAYTFNDTGLVIANGVQLATVNDVATKIGEAPNNANAYVRQALGWVIGYTKAAIDTLLGGKADTSAMTTADNLRVLKTGDTMTGALTLTQTGTGAAPHIHIAPATPSSAVLKLAKTVGAFSNNIFGNVGALQRWVVSLGNNSTESGSNAGSDFEILRYDDAGAQLASAFGITRSNGIVNMPFGATTGDLAISSLAGSSFLTLNRTGSGGNAVDFKSAGSLRWRINGSANGVDGASNAGADFTLNRYDNAGALIDVALYINRSTAAAIFSAGIQASALASNTTVAAGTGSFVGSPTVAVLGPNTGGTSTGIVLRPTAYSSVTGQIFIAPNGNTSLSGDLFIAKASPYFYLDKPASGSAAALIGRTNGLYRWIQYLGYADGETGSNAGSQYRIERYDDSGALIDVPLWISRATGIVDMPKGLTTVAPAMPKMTLGADNGGSPTFTNWNSLTAAGFFSAVLYGAATNGPGGPGFFFVETLVHLPTYLTQFAYPAWDSSWGVWTRSMNNSVWGAWVRLATGDTALAPVVPKVDSSGTIDFNNMTTAGWHPVLSLGTTNGPPVSGFFYCQVLLYASTNITQVAYPYSDTANPALNAGLWYRGRMTGVWSAWRRLGSAVNEAFATYGLNADLTVQIPFDDTTPQSSEGTQILSVTITPRFVTSKLRVLFQGQWASATAQGVTAALFSNVNGVNALAAVGVVLRAGDALPVSLNYEWTVGSVAAQTITIRVGPQNAAAMRMNGLSSARYLGGSMAASLLVEEIEL